MFLHIQIFHYYRLVQRLWQPFYTDLDSNMTKLFYSENKQTGLFSFIMDICLLMIKSASWAEISQIGMGKNSKINNYVIYAPFKIEL